MNTDFRSEFENIEGILPDWAKQKLAIISQAIWETLQIGSDIQLGELLKTDIWRNFADITEQQSNILTFYVLAGILESISQLNSKMDSIEEMNEEDIHTLQHMMDQKSQIESMISNIMKAGFDEGQSSIRTLKA